MTGVRAPQVALLGAPGDTGNLGVTALLHATLAGITAAQPDANVTVYDNGVGARSLTMALAGRQVRYEARGMRLSKRVHRQESLAHMKVSARLGGVGNAGVRALMAADAVLDISGGDSFSDIYGSKRFDMMTVSKQLVLQLRRPLVLLPQTYGPFAAPAARQRAQQIVLAANMAWARDADSFTELQGLLGSAFDPRRHRQTVDVAFGLESVPASAKLRDPLLAWLTSKQEEPVVGLNISGLLANSQTAAAQYGLKIHYRHLLARLLRLLVDHGARVVLVPHVRGGAYHESDEHACTQLRAELADTAQERACVAPTNLSPGEVKWLISHFDWFCGTRMHSTIAALSSGVPAAAVAYSPKTRGVFATCGQEAAVADGRSLDDDTALTTLRRSFAERDAHRRSLAERLPAVQRSARALWDEVLRRCAASGGWDASRRLLRR